MIITNATVFKSAPEAKVLHKEYLVKGLPHGLKKPDDGDWVCMSAEIPAEDEAGNDVVRVAGISTARHTSRSPIKLLAQHARGYSGEPTIIGRMEEYKLGTTTWKGKRVDAMFGRFSWAKDGEGTVTELAAKYKGLWDGGYLDSVSIGFRPIKSRALNAEKPWDGYEYLESELVELSIVTIPANPAATVLRAIADAFDDAPADKVGQQEITSDKDGVVTLLKQIDKALTALSLRVDDYVCEVEALASKDEEQIKGRATTPPAQTATVHADTVNAIKALAARL